ncbi:hypothetical protein NHX12_014605 [Muraenolepis orangiensis]|uniref:Ig-like domain-containing protein n=1 Tax=Muraenolepis orangiensis TaxID=630683 RepID=A0A9Q0I345_9TELE|nr:hypothetical protein NHX12_014605 [Muraenolepis orangiensis]
MDAMERVVQEVHDLLWTRAVSRMLCSGCLTAFDGGPGRCLDAKYRNEYKYGRFQVLANNNLRIHQVTNEDEGVYRCEASVD